AKFITVTGVSGSGKSTLVNEIVYKALANRLHRMRGKPGEHLGCEGIECFDKVIDIDQSPIGRTPRSNPATYTDLFTPIRELYAQTPDAKVRGYKQGRFSFNVRGGLVELAACLERRHDLPGDILLNRCERIVRGDRLSMSANLFGPSSDGRH